jgi:type II secretory ATPase GspE/PulE/Tfp pilus assembly ATPase PilB-like protein
MGTSAGRAPDEWVLPTLEALVTPEQFARIQSESANGYWEGATRMGFTADPLILNALATRFNMQVADTAQISKAVHDLVPESLMRKYRVLPLDITDSVVHIATADPHDLDCERALEFALGRTVRMSLASPSAIAQRLDELYRPENIIDNILTEFAAGACAVETISDATDDSDFDLGLSRAAERPIIQLVDRIIAAAIQAGASDIHIEPEETGIPVRYRIDGVLSQVMVLPKGAGIPLVSRVKIMADLDIANRKNPQDGRARVGVSGGKRVDLRVSTLPAAQGEKVVIRILDQRATTLTLDSLGLNPEELSRIRTLIQKKDGIIFVTGPTGSGKTTTLYSMLGVIQARGVNIVTV